MTNSNDPLTYAELQKLDDGTYIAEVRKNQASAVLRTRDTADKSWKIAATVAAVVLATGFTDKLERAPTWVQFVGVVSIVLWLVVTGLFLWVNRNPPADDPVWRRTRDSVRATMDDEFASAADRVREREVYAKLQNRTALKFVAHRSSIATAWAAVALAVTGVALGAAVLVDEQQSLTTGHLLLSPDGTTAIFAACPMLTAETLPTADVRLDTDKIGVDEPVAVRFAAGVCADLEMIVHLDGELVRGLADP